MKDYFSVLGISEESTVLEIKKAYFALVRKHPPDRFGQEFMEIREAYETLSNEETRKEYQEFAALHDQHREEFEWAQEAIQERDYEYAIEVLEELTQQYAHLLILQKILGEAYLKNENPGKAVRIFEQLHRKQPKNAAFAGYLAQSYLKRGWHKKAIKAFKIALELDEDNVSLWTEYAEAWIKSKQYAEAKHVLLIALSKEKDKDELGIYLRLLQIDVVSKQFTDMKEHLAQLKDLANKEKQITEHIAWVLAQIGMQLITEEYNAEGNILLEEAVILAPTDKDIKQFKDFAQKRAKYLPEINRLKDDTRVHRIVSEFIICKVFPTNLLGINEAMKNYVIRSNMLEIMTNIEQYTRSIQVIKDNYTDLYEAEKEFFQQLTDPRQRQKFLRSNAKKVRKRRNKLFDMDLIDDLTEEFGDFEDEFMQREEPYVREQPKVGRNEPCPCGSGRKYKHCCGKG